VTFVWPGHIVRAWNRNRARLGLGRDRTRVELRLGWAGTGPRLGQTSTVIPVAQYADIGSESAMNRAWFRPGPVPGWHPVLGGGIGGLRQLGAEPAL
jgi:hypothetical protein